MFAVLSGLIGAASESQAAGGRGGSISLRGGTGRANVATARGNFGGNFRGNFAVPRGFIAPGHRGVVSVPFRHDRFHHRHGQFGGVNVFYNGGYPWYPYDYGYGAYGGYSNPYYSQYQDAPLYYPDPAYLPAAVGASGSFSLREIQSLLARDGYYTGPIDGEMGALTRQAISDFQRDHNLSVTGRITSGVLERLGMR